MDYCVLNITAASTTKGSHLWHTHSWPPGTSSDPWDTGWRDRDSRQGSSLDTPAARNIRRPCGAGRQPYTPRSHSWESHIVPCPCARTAHDAWRLPLPGGIARKTFPLRSILLKQRGDQFKINCLFFVLFPSTNVYLIDVYKCQNIETFTSKHTRQEIGNEDIILIDECVDFRMDGGVAGMMNRQDDEWKNRQLHEWMDGWMDEKVVGR